MTPNTQITQENVGLLKAVCRLEQDMDDTADVWRHCRIAMVDAADNDSVVGFPSFTKADLKMIVAAFRPALSPPAEGEVHERNLSASNAELIGQALSHPPLTPTPAPVDWNVVGPKLVEALEDALGFIEDMAVDLRHARVADWYPEAANNAANSMSEDMRCAANRCADYEPVGVDLSEIAALAATQPEGK